MNNSTPLSKQQTTILKNMADLPVFKTANEFSLHIEKRVQEKKMTHLDAVLEFCAEHMLEPSEISSKINKTLKQKIEQNFRDLNYLPKVPQLDV